MPLRCRYLTDWLFAAGKDRACLEAGSHVSLPHTWSVGPDGLHAADRGWYKTLLEPGACGKGERVFLYFRGAYRDVAVFVNGRPSGEHAGSGYTPFCLEITDAVLPDGANEIVVRVDSGFSPDALPCGKSFDWADDGGLYRPVECRITRSAAVGDMAITADSVVLPSGRRQDGGQAVFGFRAGVSGAEKGAFARWALYRGASDSVTPLRDDAVISGSLPCGQEIVLPPRVLPEAAYWHFDRPELYTLRLRLFTPDGALSDEREWVIGFRELKLRGSRWLLNGEPVRLPGMEWMPGSDPAFGMAEPREKLEGMLRLLKESNSVLTRFHWQQDDWVYDWCDRHGLMVQEEVPFWGKQPEGDPEALWPVARRQIVEMIAAHRHHPSVIAWGVGNELSAQTGPVRRYIRRAVALAHALDGSRMANYVSNTAFAAPESDGSGDGDAPMINDYIGTWHTGFEQHSAWKALLDARPGRAFVPSEFGLCEPAFAGGDPRREEIFLEKMACYRAIPQIAGTVYFCLNDYRTHMGEEGEGSLRRRVHGSAGLCGDPKPSYFTVRREYAPLIAERAGAVLRLACRNDIPSYAVRGYVLVSGRERVTIPDLDPGESWTYEAAPGDEVTVLRPTGDFVLNA